MPFEFYGPRGSQSRYVANRADRRAQSKKGRPSKGTRKDRRLKRNKK